MKLRNKKTGEIIETDSLFTVDEPTKGVPGFPSYNRKGEYNSLTELNDEWEDALEEPNEYYCIDWTEPDGIYKTRYEDVRDDFNKEIGNCFNTREQAKKAVEKLKAWKRVKDKGISFEVKVIDRKWYLAPKAEPEQRTFDEAHDVFKDIMFIFGGEE